MAPDQLFNWAQMTFKQYFPEHQQTRTVGDWTYRGPYSNGALLGINARDGHAYIAYGPFGEGLTKLGKPTDYIAPAIKVLSSSYANKVQAAAMPPTLPPPATFGYLDPLGRPVPLWGAGFEYADFFQDGSLSAVVNTLESDRSDSYPSAPARIAFLRRGQDGQWRDETSLLLDDTTGCLSAARKTLVADFNGDARPDVFFLCPGLDLPPFSGERQRVLLSRPDGRYDNRVVTESPAYVHGGAAADIDGDGHVDVVLTHTNKAGSKPFVLLGDGQGRFTRSDDATPDAWKDKAIYTLELIDLDGDGKADLLYAGATAKGYVDTARPQDAGDPNATFFVGSG